MRLVELCLGRMSIANLKISISTSCSRECRTFFMSNSPINASGLPGSWTGKREYPLNILRIKSIVSCRVELVISGNAHRVDGLMIQDSIRAEYDRILKSH